MKGLYLFATVILLFSNSCSNRQKPITPVVDIKDENACWVYFKNKQFQHGQWALVFDDKNNVSFYNLDAPKTASVGGKLILRTGYLEVGDMYYSYSRNLTLHPNKDNDMKIRLSEDGTFIDQANFEKYEVANIKF